MESIKVVIVEDEVVISEYISECMDYFGYEVMAQCYSVQDALDCCKVNVPDILLLDINLGDKLDGIDLAHHYRKHYNFPIIFITSYAQDKFIERAKEVHPSAYLIKPFDKNALHAAISIALYNFSENTFEKKESEKSKFIPEDDACSINEAFFIKEKGKFVKVNHKDILWVEASDTYCILHTKTNKYLINQTLKKMESRMDEGVFVRVHRSFIVNVNRIESIESEHIMVANQTISVGKSYKTNLFSKLDLL